MDPDFFLHGQKSGKIHAAESHSQGTFPHKIFECVDHCIIIVIGDYFCCSESAWIFDGLFYSARPGLVYKNFGKDFDCRNCHFVHQEFLGLHQTGT